MTILPRTGTAIFALYIPLPTPSSMTPVSAPLCAMSHDTSLPSDFPASLRRASVLSGSDIFTQAKGLKVGHINTGRGGLLYHLDEFTYILNKLRPDVLGILETWLNSSTPSEAVAVHGYSFSRRNKPDDLCGAQGVGLYI